jgi:hypothetical protein
MTKSLMKVERLMNLKKALAIIVVLIIISPLAYCGIFSHEYSGPEIHGIVTDVDTGKPMPGAVVTWQWEGQIGFIAETRTTCYRVDFATTDENGVFTFPAWTINNSEVPYIFQRVDSPISIFKPGYTWFVPGNGPLKSAMELQVKSIASLSDAEKAKKLLDIYRFAGCAYAKYTMSDSTKERYIQLLKNLQSEALKLSDSRLKEILLEAVPEKLKELEGQKK